jgi:hypothetical protein
MANGEKNLGSLQDRQGLLTSLIHKVLSHNMGHSAHALMLTLRYFNYMYEVQSMFMFKAGSVYSRGNLGRNFPKPYLKLQRINNRKEVYNCKGEHWVKAEGFNMK